VVVRAIAPSVATPSAGRRALSVLTGAWLGGGIFGVLKGTFALPGFVAALSLLLLGGLTAWDRRLSPGAIGALALAVGLVHGWMNGIGIATVTFALAALVSALAVALRPPWTRIALRVAGSWVAAVGLLLLGWSLRAGG
jgi:hydrogenase/urease accessory protein HupE